MRVNVIYIDCLLGDRNDQEAFLGFRKASYSSVWMLSYFKPFFFQSEQKLQRKKKP